MRFSNQQQTSQPLPSAIKLQKQECGLRKSSSSSRFIVDKVDKPTGLAAKKNSTGASHSSPRLTTDAEANLENLPLEVESTEQNGLVSEEKMDSNDFESDETRNAPKQVSFHVGCEENLRQSEESCSVEGATYGTSNLKSFRNVETIEKIPNIDHYRNLMSIAGAMASRPTLSELHAVDREAAADLEIGELEIPEHPSPVQKKKRNASEVSVVGNTKSVGPKFGWIQGVLIRCILNIIGVMLYLRLSWVTGQAGIGLGTMIILLSCVVTTITAISMCAICTNGEIRGGGAYFMISRSLGPEFGGSIGLIFAFANAVATAMYAVGFAETVRDLMKEHGVFLFDGGLNDIRLIASVATCLLLAITVAGVAFESKAQMVLMVILLVSIVDYFVGTFIPPSPDKQAKGVTGYSVQTFRDNFAPAWRDGESFFSVLAVFFPAATGILAGANISGDLADPQKSIPKGTLLAILLTTILYIACVWLTGATVLRDVSMIMELTSALGPLITAGIFAATLSSALASLVSAPKVFQAVCQDSLFPFIHVFGKGYGKGNEPRRAYLLAFAIAVAVILIGDLNAIAPIISNFFLAAYALVNYATFDATLAKSPGFRPSFRYYNMWLSLAGAILCVAVMFVISWWTALLTFAFIGLLYLYVRHRKPEVNWGSSCQAHSYKNALLAMYKLQQTEEHIKNYRPQVLLLSGNPVTRPSLVDFAANIAKDNSLLVCGHIVFRKGPELVPTEHLLLALAKFRFQIIAWFRKRKLKSFYNPVAAGSFREGVQNLLQLSGLGKLRINLVLMGYKNNWRSCSVDQINEYFNVIHDCFDANMGVGILRVAQHGLDFSELIRKHNLEDTKNLRIPDTVGGISKHASCLNVAEYADEEEAVPISDGKLTSKLSTPLFVNGGHHHNINNGNGGLWMAGLHRQERDALLSNSVEGTPTKKRSMTPEHKGPSGGSSCVTSETEVQIHVTSEENSEATGYGNNGAMLELEKAINQFSKPLKQPVIDVWWLFDDGGLTLLVPHLLTMPKSYLEGARLRVFTIASSRRQLEQEQRSMAALLSKFRIDFSDVTLIPDITKKAAPSTIADFEQIISDFRCSDENTEASGLICDFELLANKEKTNRQLRTRELLLEHSREASLIVLTLPIPRKGSCSASLYMAWLEAITGNISAPILLLRGNQQSVLTFYS